MHPLQAAMNDVVRSWNKMCEEGLLDDIGALGTEFWLSIMIPIED